MPRLCVHVRVSSFSVTLPQSPRLTSLRGTSGGPKLCRQSILSRLACQARYTPLTPASRSLAARLVSPAFRMQRCRRSPLLVWQPCCGTWPAAQICSPCPPAGPGSCDPPPLRTGLCLQPSPLPRAAPRQNLGGALPVRLQGQQNTNWERWRFEVPPPA